MSFGMDPWTEMYRTMRGLERMFDWDYPTTSQSFLPTLTAGPETSVTTKEGTKEASNEMQKQQQQVQRWWNPRCDLCETEKNYEVHLELPGIKKEDVKIDFLNNVMTIKGQKKHQEERKGDKWHSVERRFGEFSRSFTMPQGTDPAKIQASYNNGLLVVTIPKEAIPNPEPMKIDIK